MEPGNKLAGISDNKMSKKKTDCIQCKHFYITWDPPFPYGCRAFAIKARRYPSCEVFIASGKDCQLFEMKRFGEIEKNNQNTNI